VVVAWLAVARTDASPDLRPAPFRNWCIGSGIRTTLQALCGANTFTDPGADRAAPAKVDLARATEAEKQSQLDRLADFQARHAETAPAALRRLKAAAAGEQNVFAALMEAVRHCSLGQISEAFFEVGGQDRRNV